MICTDGGDQARAAAGVVRAPIPAGHGLNSTPMGAPAP